VADEAAVTALVRRHLPPQSSSRLTDSGESLADLGLESLDLVALIADLESTFEIEFPDEMLDPATFRSVLTIAEAVSRIQMG
jgi:acyl carrier protein